MRRGFLRQGFLAGLLVLGLSACATAAGPARYSGVFDFHFETAAFTTDAGEGPYWLVGEGDTWPQLTAPFAQAGGPWGQAHIVVEGELSPPGQYGHLGAYEHELRVTRVIESSRVSVRP